MTKRLADLVLATIGLIVLAPVFVVLATAIKVTSRGPVLFRQERVGLHGSRFTIYKFRTMSIDAAGTGPSVTVRNDPRITAVGSWLRRTKLDELPQLCNVIIGDMSFVGPRAEVPQYVAHYPEAAYVVVLSVRPGMTDNAVIAIDEDEILAGADDPEQTYIRDVIPAKLALYERYVERHNLLTDLVIIGRSLLRVLQRARRR